MTSKRNLEHYQGQTDLKDCSLSKFVYNPTPTKKNWVSGQGGKSFSSGFAGNTHRHTKMPFAKMATIHILHARASMYM